MYLMTLTSGQKMRLLSKEIRLSRTVLTVKPRLGEMFHKPFEGICR